MLDRDERIGDLEAQILALHAVRDSVVEEELVSEVTALVIEAHPSRPAPAPESQLRTDQVIGVEEIERRSIEVELREDRAEHAHLEPVASAGVAHAPDAERASETDQGRGLKRNWAEYADGRVLSGSEAFQLGFVDQKGNFEDAVKRAEKLAGISAANLIQFQQRFDITDLFRLFGKSESRTVKVDLGVEGPKLQAGQLYFLSPTFAH